MSPSVHVRPPAVAGMFYPADADALARDIQAYMAGAPTAKAEAPKALIVPHAGHIYSGAIAASAYARLMPARDRIRRVVMLGPAHRVRVSGLAAPSVDLFETPLGSVAIDRIAIAELVDLPQVRIDDVAHAGEHCLEVQLPFLQLLLQNFSLVPLVVGAASAEQVSEVIERLWGGPETIVIISSDLSHYHDYRTAQRLDRATSNAIEALDPERIDYDDACGRNPIQGLLLCAQRHGLRATTIDLRNSGDTAGPSDRVVGYGAYVFE